MEVRQIIEGLECLVTKQHKCEGCPFNPHPGMDWPYGCGRGQGDAVRAAKEALERMEDGDLISRKSVLAGIDELRESPWFNWGKGMSQYHDRYLARKEGVEIVADLCVRREPAVVDEQGREQG